MATKTKTVKPTKAAPKKAAKKEAKPMYDIFHAKVKFADIAEGEELEVLINEQQAWEHGISPTDKVVLIYKGQEIVLNANLTTHLVKPGEVGLYKEVYAKYKIPADSAVAIHFTQVNGKALDALKKALGGKRLNFEETKSIMYDIGHNKFTDILTTYYGALGFFKKATDQELYEMAKAMAETGEMLHFDGVVADKHCMGGVPGNETTMIMIPLLTSLGIKMPKTFSKAITTPAATGECVNVLMDISFSKPQIENLVKKNNCCLVWGGGLDLAPADEKLIKVAYPLSMQSYSRTVVSIMAKKYAMGVNHSLIDIPMGPTAKVPDMKTAKWLKQKYEFVGKKLGMKVHVEITPALQPIGSGIGAVLQVREVLRVLQQHANRPADLEEKAIFLASKIIELVGLAKGKKAYALAKEQLVSGKAWKKMQEIIKSQGGKNPNQKSEDLQLAKHSKQILADKAGTVKTIDMKLINLTARTLGSPIDSQSGLYLSKKLGDKVKKGDVLYTMYASEESKIAMAVDMLKEKVMYEIK